MVDIWLLCMMLYPFFLVILLASMEIFNNSELTTKSVSGKWTGKEERGIKTISFLLRWVLPMLLLIFMLIYWTIRLYNVVPPNACTIC